MTQRWLPAQFVNCHTLLMKALQMDLGTIKTLQERRKGCTLVAQDASPFLRHHMLLCVTVVIVIWLVITDLATHAPATGSHAFGFGVGRCHRNKPACEEIWQTNKSILGQ